MTDFSIKVTGLSQLDKALREFAPKVQRKMLTKSLRAAAKVVQTEAQASAPSDTGTLKRNIVVRSASKRGAAARVSIGIRTKTATFADSAKNRRAGRAGKRYRVAGDAYYARFVEFGTKSHTLIAKRKVMRGGKRGVFAFEVGGKTVFARSIKHPGTRPRPFLRPSLERKTPQAIEAMRLSLAQQIQQEYHG
jgi:HK97 gp10 family phage protein